MIRVVVEETTTLSRLGIVDAEKPEDLPTTFERDGGTYYKALVKHHFVLYRRALSGWGAAGQPGDTRPTFDARQQ